MYKKREKYNVIFIQNTLAIMVCGGYNFGINKVLITEPKKAENALTKD